MKKKIKYGKWYSCSECMPEDFGNEAIDTVFLLRVHNKGKRFQTDRRLITSFRKEWLYHFDSDITHWLAIPPIN